MKRKLLPVSPPSFYYLFFRSYPMAKYIYFLLKSYTIHFQIWRLLPGKLEKKKKKNFRPQSELIKYLV